MEAREDALADRDAEAALLRGYAGEEVLHSAQRDGRDAPTQAEIDTLVPRMAAFISSLSIYVNPTFVPGLEEGAPRQLQFGGAQRRIPSPPLLAGHLCRRLFRRTPNCPIACPSYAAGRRPDHDGQDAPCRRQSECAALAASTLAPGLRPVFVVLVSRSPESQPQRVNGQPRAHHGICSCCRTALLHRL